MAIHLAEIDQFIRGQPGRKNDALGFLYAMLAKRPAVANISHRRLPTWDEHCRFVESAPYENWWLISADGERSENISMPWIGNVYVTRQREVGLHIMGRYQRHGYGTQVMEELEKQYDWLLANVAPSNEDSQKFFHLRGYDLVQHTYRWEK